MLLHFEQVIPASASTVKQLRGCGDDDDLGVFEHLPAAGLGLPAADWEGETRTGFVERAVGVKTKC